MVVDRSSDADRHPPFKSGLALKSIADFACLGSSCEDDCCSGWSVPLSEDDVERMRRATRTDIGTRKTFQAIMGDQTDSRVVRGTTAILPMGDDGSCSFLNSEKLCKIQIAAGPEAIPTVCGLYPRRMSAVGTRLEMTPLLSCPEAVRGLLLSPDGAHLVDLDPKAHTRIVANHFVPESPQEPYERYMDDVRALILELLNQSDVPFEVRLFWVTAFANGVDGFFGRGCDTFDEGVLRETLRQFADAGNLAQLWTEFENITPEHTLGASVAYQVITPRAKSSRKLTELFARAMSTYGPESGLEAAFIRQAQALDTALAPRWDAYFTRLSIHSWVQGYLDSDTIMDHCRSLAIRLHTIRFLILGDPDLDEVRHQVEGGRAQIAELEDAFDKAFVRVLYQFTRATDHDPEFWEGINADLDSNGFNTFGHVVRLVPRSMGISARPLLA